MTQYWNEETGQLEPTYWDVAGKCWTDPPRLKMGSRRNRRKKTHALHKGKALCGKPYPHWFHWPDEAPTCEECLKQMIQLP